MKCGAHIGHSQAKYRGGGVRPLPPPFLDPRLITVVVANVYVFIIWPTRVVLDHVEYRRLRVCIWLTNKISVSLPYPVARAAGLARDVSGRRTRSFFGALRHFQIQNLSRPRPVHNTVCPHSIAYRWAPKHTTPTPNFLSLHALPLSAGEANINNVLDASHWRALLVDLLVTAAVRVEMALSRDEHTASCWRRRTREWYSWSRNRLFVVSGTDCAHPDKHYITEAWMMDLLPPPTSCRSTCTFGGHGKGSACREER